MRLCFGLFLGILASAQPQSTIREFTHESQVIGAPRGYRAVLPPSYAASQRRYPVVDWLHGFETEAEQQQFDRETSAYAAQHEVIVIHSGPVETVGSFPLYFPELVEQVDKSLRTVPDRDHRAVTGYSAGGFMALWTAGKYPDLVSSASSIMGPTEYTVGPQGFAVECNFDDFYSNYGGVRVRLVTGSRDFLHFYQRRLADIWKYALADFDNEEFDAPHSAPAIPKTLDFHLAAFNKPLPKPPVFSHADVYPNFGVWGWEISSDRRRPAITLLQNLSRTGFRSAVREWIPSGATIPEVKLSVSTPQRTYVPGSTHPVTFIHLPDGKVRRAAQKVDAQGRLSFDLDGDAWEVGIGAEPVPAIAGFDFVGASWATAGQPVRLRVKFSNKGSGRMPPAPLQWEAAGSGVKIESPSPRLFGLVSGEMADTPLTITVSDPARAFVRITAVVAGAHLPLELRLWAQAAPTKDFQIADGRALTVFQKATQKVSLPLGDGNGDGYASPGESFAVLIPDGDAYRAAELFTADPCVDNSERVSDSWSDYDHSGASVKFSLPRILPACEPGTIVHMLARVVFPDAPNHTVRYYSLEFPVWWRPK